MKTNEPVVKMKEVLNGIAAWLSENCGVSRLLAPAKDATSYLTYFEEVDGGWRQNS
jgi:hypothetical protein